MLGEICKELNNWFTHDKDKHFGTFAISDGTLDLSYLLEGQYFRIVGSKLNDGVYQYPISSLKDETFDGAVWAMSVPSEVLKLEEDVASWVESYGATVASPYNSESFGGYSYSKSSGADSATWQKTFRARLNSWRKV